MAQEALADLELHLIRTDGGTQMRVELSQDVCLDYGQKMLTGVSFAPLDVFHDGSQYWLADGFHRYFGARDVKLEKLPCRIRNGTQRDALFFAIGANVAHGLRRTNADKRRAVEAMLNDADWVQWSDGLIADKAAVSQQLVSMVREELTKLVSSRAALAADKPRLGRDGKKRKPRSRNGARRNRAEKRSSNSTAAPAVGNSGNNGSASAACAREVVCETCQGRGFITIKEPVYGQA